MAQHRIPVTLGTQLPQVIQVTQVRRERTEPQDTLATQVRRATPGQGLLDTLATQDLRELQGTRDTPDRRVM